MKRGKGRKGRGEKREEGRRRGEREGGRWTAFASVQAAGGGLDLAHSRNKKDVEGLVPGHPVLVWITPSPSVWSRQPL